MNRMMYPILALFMMLGGCFSWSAEEGGNGVVAAGAMTESEAVKKCVAEKGPESELACLRLILSLRKRGMSPFSEDSSINKKAVLAAQRYEQEKSSAQAGADCPPEHEHKLGECLPPRGNAKNIVWKRLGENSYQKCCQANCVVGSCNTTRIGNCQPATREELADSPEAKNYILDLNYEIWME